MQKTTDAAGIGIRENVEVETVSAAQASGGHQRLPGYEAGDRTSSSTRASPRLPLSPSPSKSLLDRAHEARDRLLDLESKQELSVAQRRKFDELEDEIDRIEALGPEADARDRFYAGMTELAQRIAALTEPDRR
jgi:hypothetical protein